MIEIMPRSGFCPESSFHLVGDQSQAEARFLSLVRFHLVGDRGQVKARFLSLIILYLLSSCSKLISHFPTY